MKSYFFHLVFSMDINKVLTILQEATHQFANKSLNSSQVTKEILSQAYHNDWTGDHLEHFCHIYYTWTLETPENVEVSAVLVQDVISLEIDGKMFRTHWFHRLQEDFQNALVLKMTNRRRWINFASYLCKILVNLTINGAPILVILGPTCTCLDMLLTSQDTTSEEIECGVKQLVNCGPLLTEYYSDGLDQLMTKIRHKILASDTPLVGQTFLLEAFELYLGEWKLKSSVKEYYKNRLFEIQVPLKDIHDD
ncbi:MIF4G domain-containing protein B-like [Apostichopus japonicus]|uniref:MIF4G domain-containing protein B-like n=1 Tax=Stichopus japonicus TaxID=307972 RepID=UPI003AB29421